jgi:FkbM family methyltransferase
MGLAENRTNYDLNSNSIVIEVGGFEGVFSGHIINKFDCNVLTFEPSSKFYQTLNERFKNCEKVKTFNYGLGHKNSIETLAILSDGSSMFLESEKTEQITIRDISEVLDELNIDEVDLMEINCEGSEYQIIPHLVETGYINKIKNVQIQFHKWFPNSDEERKKCHEGLGKTHEMKWNFEWNFESWTKK